MSEGGTPRAPADPTQLLRRGGQVAGGGTGWGAVAGDLCEGRGPDGG